MVPTFLGEHYSVNCADCNFSFPVDAKTVPNHGNATCPNCGYTKNSYRGLKLRDATPIILEVNEPMIKRWDVVAFQFSDLNLNGMKRVVGLPGETVIIQRGDVWIDGKWARRNWSTKQEMKVLSFDSDFSIDESESTVSRWRLSGGWEFDKQVLQLGVQQDAASWAIFQPIVCYRGGDNREPISHIQDNYGFNQSNSRGRLNTVDQLILEFDLRILPDSRVVTLFPREDRDIGFLMDGVENQIVVFVDGKIFGRANFEANQEWYSVSISTVDDEFQIYLDGTLRCEAGEKSLGRVQGDFLGFPTALTGMSPVGIYGTNSSGANIQIRHLKIYRDLYYTDRGNSKFELGKDEYLVLGDNSPVSVDSRTWANPKILGKQILGKVKRMPNR